MMSGLLLCLFVFLASWQLTRFIQRSAYQRQLIDVPVARSAHSIPTPTGGGLAIVLTHMGGLITAALLQLVTASMLLLLLPAGAIALLGLFDDRHQLDFRWRICVHFLAAAITSIALGILPPIPLGTVLLQPGIWSVPVVLLILVWATNLYNFMDGIDGLAGAQTCFLCLAAAFLLWSAEDHRNMLAFLILCAACAGFLVLNWPPAKIFMGDTGSGFLGFLLACMALLTIHAGTVSPWSWVLLPAVFIVDATVTVVRRMLKGRAWYQAHSSHAYQHAARRYGHLRVTCVVILINLCWLLPLSVAASDSPEYGVYYALVGIVPLVVLAIGLRAGQENKVMQPGSL